MKSLTTNLLMYALLPTVSITVPARAAEKSHESLTVDQILQQIRSEMQLGPEDRIDSRKVPDPLLSKLGDAVMDQMLPNSGQHKFMDQMMGGEGSASLESMHRWMAYRYLSGGFSSNSQGFMGPGMMGGGMMGNGGGMMGSGGGGWGMMGNPNLPYSNIPHQSPEEIAKSRYTRGEITREQYQQIMKDLHKLEPDTDD